MAERLDFIKLRPQQVYLLDTSAWLGASAEALKAVYPQAQLLWRHAGPDLARSCQAALAATHLVGAWSWGAGPVGQRCPDATAQLVWANLGSHPGRPACVPGRLGSSAHRGRRRLCHVLVLRAGQLRRNRGRSSGLLVGAASARLVGHA